MKLDEFPDFRNARMVRQTGCVNWEVRFTTSIVFAWIGILAVYVSAYVITFSYLFFIILIAFRNNIILKPEFKYEQCLHY